SPPGVMSNVYSRAVTPSKFDTVPLMTINPATPNPVTSSLNETLNGIAVSLVGLDDGVNNVAVGPVVSNVRVTVFEAGLPLPAASWAAFAATATETSPAWAGFISTR